MAKHRGQAQITLVDLNDAKQLVSYISSKLQRQTIFNPNSNVYLPNYSINPQVLTPQLFIAGRNDDIADKAVAVRWYYQENSNGTPIRITGNTDTYELSKSTPTTLKIKRNIFEGVTSMNFIVELDYVDEDTSTSLVTSAKSMIELTKITNGTDGKNGENVNTMILSNESHTISTNSDGSGGSYTNAITDVMIYNGNRDDTKNWTFTVTPSAGISGQWDGSSYSYKVSGMSTDTGTVTINAAKSGHADLSKVYSLSKAKQGLGKDAVSTWMLIDTNIIYQDNAGEYDRSTINILGKAQVGTNPVGDYAGRFKIYESTDGSNFIEKFKSTVNESSRNYRFSAGIKAIKVEFYEAGDTTNLIDHQQVTVLVQPDDAISAYLTNESVTIPTKNDGSGGSYANAQTKLVLLRGATEINGENGWSITASPSSGVTGSLTDFSYRVSNMSVDSGFVDIIVTRQGYSKIIKRFSINKNKDGLDGANPIYRWGDISTPVIIKKNDGSLSPSSISITSSSQKGDENVLPYSGRFKIYESIDNSKTWTLKYTSSTDESIKTYSLNDTTITNLKVEYYLSGAVTTKYDESSVIVVKDGKSGVDGQNAKLLYLSSTADVIKFDSSDSVILGQSISFSSNLQNLSGISTFTATPFIRTVAQSPITLNGSGNTRVLLGEQWSKNWDRIVVTATLGNLSDTKTIIKIKESKDGSKGDRGNDGDTSYFHRAWSWSADGKDRFTTTYPNENLVLHSNLQSDLGWKSQSSNITTSFKDGIASISKTTIDANRGYISTWIDSPQPNKKYSASIKILINAAATNLANSEIFLRVTKKDGTFLDYGKASLSGIEKGKWVTVKFNGALLPSNTDENKAMQFFIIFGKDSLLSAQVTEPKVEMHDTATIYTCSPSEDFDKAYPTYMGTLTDFIEEDSNNHSDYTWSRFTAEANVTGFLTNENITLGASATGVVGDFSKAKGIFKLFDGLTDRTGMNTIYSKLKETGCIGFIDSTTGEYSVSNMTTDTATLELRATYKGVNIDKVFVLSKSKTGQSGANGSDSYNAILSNDNVTIATDPSGNNGNYNNANTTISVYKGITDDTNNWTILINKSNTISGTLNGYKYSVTNMTSDTGFVQLIMKKDSITLVKEFTLQKNKRATDGQDAVSYWLITGNSVVKKDGEGNFSPNFITFYGYKQKGEENAQGFEGYFTIDESLDSFTWESKYSSSTKEKSVFYVISRSVVKSIRVRLYYDQNKTILLDEQTIVVIEDGENPLLTILTTPEGNTVKNNDGKIVVRSDTYHGSEKVTPDEVSWYLSDTDQANGWSKISGRRNYVPNSKYYTIVPDNKDNWDWNGIKINNDFFDNPDRLISGNIKFSFTIRAKTALPEDFKGNLYFRSSPWYAQAFVYPKGTTEKRRINLTYTISDPNYTAIETFIRFMNNHGPEFSFVIEDVQLEIGKTFTDWSPAPEDTNLVLGNTNLLVNSNFKKGIDSSWYNYENKVKLTDQTYRDSKVIMLNQIETGRFYQKFDNAIMDKNIQIGDDLTATFYACGENVNDSLHFELWGGTGARNIKLTKKWEKYVVNVKYKGISTFFLWNTNFNSATEKCYVTKIKLELGNRSTDWCQSEYENPDSLYINHESILIPATRITNILGVKVKTKYNSIEREATTSIVDVSDPMQLQIIGSGAFKNGTGSNTYIARVYQAGIEIDSDGKKGNYKWTLRDRNNNQIGGWSKTGKQISINANDFVSNATIVCEVEF